MVVFTKGQTVTVQSKAFFYGNPDGSPFEAVVVSDALDTDTFVVVVFGGNNKVRAVPFADVA